MAETVTTDPGSEFETLQSEVLARLKEEIKPLIVYHSGSEDYPPFPVNVLIVLALVQAEGSALIKQAEIEAEIRQALAEKYDLPVRAQRKNIGRGLRRGQDKLVYSVTAQAARAILSPWTQERKGTFPFLQLPPELRNQIYDLVFTLPPSGLSLDRCPGSSQVTARLLERAGEVKPCEIRWTDRDAPKGSYALTGHMNGFLALLSANRQIFAEAMPLVYSCNTFHLAEPGMWVVALDMPRERVKHLRKLSFDFSPTDGMLVAWRGAFEILARKPGGFEELIIRAEDHLWPDLDDPAFCALASLINNAGRILWRESCPAIRDQVAKLLGILRDHPRELEPLKVEEERVKDALERAKETQHRRTKYCALVSSVRTRSSSYHPITK
ncbi:hypothetical protein KC342_g18467 [Hortaea werneckii]|nr:hypothetical protein KC342_g18467 [Hortaea werneckii]KAI7380360.1 hypothetical protein KC328_g12842 [Hortaea werneckii]